MSMDSATGRKQGFIILASDENPDEGNNAAIIAVAGQHSALVEVLPQFITKPETADLAKEAFAFVAFKKIINLKD